MNHVMAMQPNPKKAVLSDLYQRKGAGLYPIPTSSHLVALSRHERDDRNPSHEGGDRSDFSRVQSDLPGKGMWKRYDGSKKPWHHAKLSNRADAFGIVKLVKDGKAPKDGMAMFAFNKISYLSSDARTKQTSLLSTAITKVNHECSNINVCSHDVYVSTPVGEDNDNVFSPGLNQLWVIMDSGRHEILTNVVIAARADDDAVAYFAGCPRSGNEAFHTVMSFDFNQFSTPVNPLNYLVTASSSNGFASVQLDIAHVGYGYSDGASPYTIVKWTLSVGSIGGWFDRGSSGASGNILIWWSTKQEHNEFNYFITKGMQIYDICHCYHTNSGQLHVCLNGSVGETFEDKIASDILGGTYEEKKDESWLWNQRPRGLKSGSWRQCYSNFNR
jgi:hypothetical protein